MHIISKKPQFCVALVFAYNSVDLCFFHRTLLQNDLLVEILRGREYAC